jgi:hypothetical protein
MPNVRIEPVNDKPVPYDLSDEVPDTALDELAVAGNTAELQHALGATLELPKADADKAKALIDAAILNKKTQNLSEPNTAFAAAAFLRSYGQHLAMDVAQARAAITNKLMELANCGDPRYELKALELLGKHSDIGIFTTRSEITVNYKNPQDLENEIKERVKRLLNASIVSTVPVEESLDEYLGVFQRKPDEDEDEYTFTDEAEFKRSDEHDAREDGDDE